MDVGWRGGSFFEIKIDRFENRTLTVNFCPISWCATAAIKRMDPEVKCVAHECLKMKQRLPIENYTLERQLEKERKRRESTAKYAPIEEESEQMVAAVIEPIDTRDNEVRRSLVMGENTEIAAEGLLDTSWRRRALQFAEEEERLTQEAKNGVAGIMAEVRVMGPANEEGTLKHRRISELRSRRSVTLLSPNTSSSSASSDVTPMTTPQRECYKRIMAESTDSPNTKRMKQLLKTPGHESPEPKTPENTSCLRDPGSEFPGDTPNTRIRHRRIIQVLDKYYISPGPNVKDKTETPLNPSKSNGISMNAWVVRTN